MAVRDEAGLSGVLKTRDATGRVVFLGPSSDDVGHKRLRAVLRGMDIRYRSDVRVVRFMGSWVSLFVVCVIDGTEIL